MDYIKTSLRLCAFARNTKLVAFLMFSISTFAQVDKVEPPFWWSDMNRSDVQIMFYGKNIAQNEVSVSNGIIIKELDRALKRTPERMLSYSDDEIKEIESLLTAASLATSLEKYSREVDAIKVKQPELV